MSDHVQIEPKGLYLYKWDGDKRRDVRSRVKRSRVLTYLRSECRIKDGTTLGDIFRMVASYPVLKAVIAAYSWCPQIDEFHSQAQEPMRSEDNEPLDYLEVYHGREVGLTREKKGDPWTTYMGHSVEFHGIGTIRDPEKWRKDYGCEPPKSGTQNYSVSYTPTYDLVDLPVRINTRVKVWDYRKRGGESVLLEADECLSLLEVLDAIYWDISFVGGPAENAEFIEDMKEQVAEIKGGLASSGKRYESVEEMAADMGLELDLPPEDPTPA